MMKNCLELSALCCIVLLMLFANRCHVLMTYVKVFIIGVSDDWYSTITLFFVRHVLDTNLL